MEPELTGMMRVKVDQIDLTGLNPRKSKELDDEQLEELAGSIRNKGLLQPVLLRPHPARNDRYELVCGERRWRASKKAGLEEIPATIREMTDEEAMEAMLDENIQREELMPLEEAEAFNGYALKGLSASEIAAKFNKSRRYIYGRLILLKLPERARVMLAEGDLTIGGAMLIGQIPNDNLREVFVNELGDDRYDESHIEDLIARGYRTDLQRLSSACGLIAAVAKPTQYVLHGYR